MHKETRWLLNEKYHGKETPAFRADLQRLEAGEPLAYVIGWVDFLGCRIDLSAHPLIPRTETEFWVEQAIVVIQTNCHSFADRPNYGSSGNGTIQGVWSTKVKNISPLNPRHKADGVFGGLNRAFFAGEVSDTADTDIRAFLAAKPQGHCTPLKILDLFSGSGCIGIAFAKHLPNAHIDFGEKDPTLCTQIKKNIAVNNIDNTRTRIFETDVFSGITDSYDLIVANPPYIDPAKKETVESAVLHHEPHEALFAEEHGLALIRELLLKAPDHLTQGGKMYIEFGENQKEDIAILAEKTDFAVEFLKDQFGKWRVAQLTRS